jgi:hypothetical protein
VTEKIMDPSFRAKLLEFLKAWTMVEIIVRGTFYVLAILLFFGYAIYAATHHGRF